MKSQTVYFDIENFFFVGQNPYSENYFDTVVVFDQFLIQDYENVTRFLFPYFPYFYYE